MIRKWFVNPILIVFALSMLLTGCETKQEVTAGCKIYKKLPSDIARAVDINYDNKIKFLGITVKKLSDKQLKVNYYWQQLDDLNDHNTVFVHFTNKDGKVLMQNDHDFCSNFNLEQLKNKFAAETYLVNIPEVAVGQNIEVKLGIYSKELKSRLKVNSSPGISLDDNKTRAIVEKFKL